MSSGNPCGTGSTPSEARTIWPRRAPGPRGPPANSDRCRPSGRSFPVAYRRPATDRPGRWARRACGATCDIGPPPRRPGRSSTRSGRPCSASFSRRLAATYIFRPAAALAMAASAARAAAPPSVGTHSWGKQTRLAPWAAASFSISSTYWRLRSLSAHDKDRRDPHSLRRGLGLFRIAGGCRRGDKNQRKSERHAFHRISPVRSWTGSHFVRDAVVPPVRRAEVLVGLVVAHEPLAIAVEEQLPVAGAVGDRRKVLQER